MFTDSIRQRLTRFRKDEDGIVTVEFAFILPLMIFMYLGLFQISMVIMQDRHVTHSASTMADLATQVRQVDATDVADIMQAGIQVMQISNPHTLTNDVHIELMSWQQKSDGTYEQVGYAKSQGANFPTFDPSTIDSRMLDSNSGALVARVEYDFKLLSNGNETTAKQNRFIDGGATLREQFIAKPRIDATLPFVDGSDNPGASYSCTIAADASVSCS